MLTVYLNVNERKAAASFGEKREALRHSRGIHQDFDKRGDGGPSMEKRNQVGAIAEWALAKHLGPDIMRDWCENKAFSLNHHTITSDVGKNIQIRASDNRNATLWMYHHDHYPTAPFVLARVFLDRVVFVGWLFGQDGQVPEYWDLLGWSRFGNDRACFNIPMTALRPMEELPSECIR